MTRVPAFLTTFLLFFLPFVIFPIGSSQFEVPKVILAQILIELLVVVRVLQHDAPKLLRTSMAGYLALFAISLLGLIFFRTEVSFFGNTYRLQGIFLFWHLLLFSIFAAKDVLRHASAFLLLLFLIVQLGGDFVFGANDVGRSFGLLGEPNSLAAAAVFAFPILFIKKNKKKLTYLCLLLIVVVLVISGSRSGVMAFLVQCFFLVAAWRFPKRYGIVTLSAILLIILTLFTPFLASNAHESRVEIWYAAMLSFLHNPVIGGGFGNIDTLLHKESLMFASYISERYVDSSHNIFLDILIQSGLVGMGAFLYLLGRSFITFFFQRDTVALCLLLGFITVLSFNPVSVWILLVFWYLLGQGILGNRISTHQHV